ncbi:MAG: hypothetical protein WBW73_24405, partial [Rhodoplanes sp.]
MLRMQLVTDFLRQLLNKGKIDKETYERIHMDGNTAINGHAPDPFGVVMSRSEEIGLSKKDLELELEIAQNKVRRLSAVNSGASRHDAICVRETAWLRARCLWLRAVDLDNGGSFLDFPPALVDRLIAE